MENQKQIRIVFVGKRKKPIVWASNYLWRKHKYHRLRMLDGVGRILNTVYGHIRYYKFPWEKRFNVYNALYRHDNEVWVKYLERRLPKFPRSLTVDDPHYTNEVKYLKETLSFIVVRITVATELRPSITHALGDSEPGTVLLNEWFPKTPPAYKVDYSISVADRAGLYVALEGLLLQLSARPEYNVVEGEEPKEAALYEEKERTLNENTN